MQKKMSVAQDALYPKFATHNAYSVAAILTLIDLCYDDYQFKFQNLQNMVKALHYCVTTKLNLPWRIYAPAEDTTKIFCFISFDDYWRTELTVRSSIELLIR